MPSYKITKLDKMVCSVDVMLAKGEKSFTVFSMPDAHWDNPKCERELLMSHLKKAKSEKALIVLPGDTFCMMQGKYDPRGSKSDVRPEHNVNKYLDAVIDDAANYFRPFSETMIVGQGNHESAILKRAETDVLERFAAKMGDGVPVMGYQFWVVLRIFMNGRHRATQRMYFHHGYGGGGPVTRGQISFSRYAMHIEGADTISQGHIHEKSTGEIMAHYFDDHSQSQKAKLRSVLLLQSSTYKQEYVQGGFHIEKGRPPKPLGGVCVTFHVDRNDYKGGGAVDIVKEARLFSTKTITL